MRTVKDTRPVLVAGGGIGGLAAALALVREGYRVKVIEQAGQIGEIGAGIQLSPNAFAACDALGVGEHLRAKAVYTEEMVMFDAIDAKRVASISLSDRFRERFGNPYAVIHRGDLHGVLLAAVRANPNVQLHVDCEVVGYGQDGARVEAILADGRRIPGAALIGADGLWSKIRAQLVNDGAPRVSGHTTYRSVIPTELMPEDLRWNAATLWAGPKCHVVHYPLSGWKLFNLVVTYHNDAPEPVAGKPVDREEVLRGFQHVDKRVQGIIERGGDWKQWVLCDRDPTTNWVDGRVALLGDAAHPMMQYFAQGACMALEDAVGLAVEMGARPDDLDGALEAYRQRRMLRTARVQLQSREIGDHIYHPAGAHALLRNSILRAKSADDLYNDLSWLYAERPDSASQA